MQSSEAVQSTQPTAQQTQPPQSMQTYPEELEKAWKALRDFWVDVIREVEIEQELTKKYQKDHDNHKEH